MVDPLPTKFVYLDLYLLCASVNHVCSVLRLGGANFVRMLHSGGWIFLRCKNCSVLCYSCNCYYAGIERIR